MINSVKQAPYFEYSIEELKPKNTHNIDIDELLGEYHAEY